MKLLKEALADFNVEDEEEQLDLDADHPAETPEDNGSEEQDLDLDLDGDTDQEDAQELDDVADTASQNPDRQGVIRHVKNAHLVYKRETENGRYDELWIYNIDTLRDELETRKAILSGTDIPTNKTRSPDGEQQYRLWTVGNAEMLEITGLPS